VVRLPTGRIHRPSLFTDESFRMALTPDQPRSSRATAVAGVPFWRDARILGVLAQIVFVIVAVISLGWIGNNAARGLRALGAAQFSCGDGTSSFRCAFDFMSTAASFDIAEKPIDYNTKDSYWQALEVGALNTIKVAVIGIILATLLGLVTGIAVLSNNWLLNRIAQFYIDIIRNTPLLVQLFFLYFAVILQFPQLNNSLQPMPGVFLSQRGIALPWPVLTASFLPWLAFIVLGLIQFQILLYVLGQHEAQTGKPTHRWQWSALAGLAIIVAGWYLTVAFSQNEAALVSRASQVAQASNPMTGFEALVTKRLGVSNLTQTNLANLDPTRLAQAALQVCVVSESSAEPNFATQLRSHNIPFKMNRFDQPDQAGQAYAAGQCDALIGEQVLVAAERSVLGKPGDHLLVPIMTYPLVISTPQLEGLNLVGGVKLTPEFAAILFGLVLYTAAFIAEIVRSGIQAVPPGQSEAVSD
jgi:His/Glu/Gln/Arg/opine family amino acid ABC transporter permease subunit